MNKKLLLLAGILALGATTFAAYAPTETLASPTSKEKPSGEQATLDSQQAVDIITTTDSSTIQGLVAGRQAGDGTKFSGTYTGEIKTRMYQGPGRSDKENNGNYSKEVNRVEWTVAKGKLNMDKFGFIYDVDRDYRFDKKGKKTREGWDTTFGFDYQGGTFDMMGKEWTFNPSIAYDYDKSDSYTSKSATPDARDSETRRLLKINPKVSTTYYGFATDISPYFVYDDITGNASFQLDVSLFRALNKNWSYYGDFYVDIAGTKNDKSTSDGSKVYSNAFYSGNIDADNKVAYSMEQYLNYSKQLGETQVFFSTEFGLEAYSMLQSEKSDVGMYAAPKLQYKAHVGQWSVAPYAMYTAYANTDSYKSDGSSNTYANQLSVGVTFGTKF